MAPAKILVTGAAGFIGGSIITDFLAGAVPSLEKSNVIAAVRSEEQAEALHNSDLNVVYLDLADEEAVKKSIKDYHISIVVHVASSLDPNPAKNLINGLSEQRKATGKQTYFIHTSAMSAFTPTNGWPLGKLHGSGNEVFETEKQLAESYPVRNTDATVIEHCQSQGVTSFIVIPCAVHGKGTGVWNKLSILIPITIKASIEGKQVRRFAENKEVPYVHISDLTALYGRIVEKILQSETPPNGPKGYYFSTAHRVSTHEFTDRLAAALHARGLVSSAQPEVWSNTEAAAKALGVPAKFIEPLWNAGDDDSSPVMGNSRHIGWQPKWSKERFLDNINDEIDAVLELGSAKSSLVASLFVAAKE